MTISTRHFAGIPVCGESEAGRRGRRSGRLTIDNATYEAPRFGIAAVTIRTPEPAPSPGAPTPVGPVAPAEPPAMGPTGAETPTRNDDPR